MAGVEKGKTVYVKQASIQPLVDAGYIDPPKIEEKEQKQKRQTKERK